MYIYRITNLVNFKVYIGLDSRPVYLKARWKEHIRNAKSDKDKKILYRGMRKYGVDNFTFEILEELNTIEALKSREEYWIFTLKSTDRKIGYNRTKGGETFAWNCMTEQEIAASRQKMITSRRTQWERLSDFERRSITLRRSDGLRIWWQENYEEASQQRRSTIQTYWDSQSQSVKNDAGRWMLDGWEKWWNGLSGKERNNFTDNRLKSIQEWRKNLSTEEIRYYADLKREKWHVWYNGLSDVARTKFNQSKKEGHIKWWNSLTGKQRQQNQKVKQNGWRIWWNSFTEEEKTKISQSRLAASLETRRKNASVKQSERTKQSLQKNKRRTSETTTNLEKSTIPKTIKAKPPKEPKTIKEKPPKETSELRRARLLKASFASGLANAKTFDVQSPHQENFRIKNLNQFCKAHDLDQSNMLSVSNGKQSHHKGWKCWHVNENGVRIFPKRKTIWERETVWTARDQHGNIFHITNLKNFCVINNLSYSSMLKVAKRQRKQHVGWTIVEGRVDESDFQKSYGINRPALRQVGK